MLSAVRLLKCKVRLCIYTFAMSVAASVVATAGRLLECMADNTGHHGAEMINLHFEEELVPMQLIIAKQWSKVLATALDAEGPSACRRSRGKIVIPMDCSKHDWLLAMSFCYPTSPPQLVTWQNLEVCHWL